MSAPLALPEHGVTTVFVDTGNTKLELLEPLGAQSPIAKFLEKNPDGGLHHLCFEVPDLAAAIATVKAAGIRVLGEPRIGAHGLPVVFLHPKDCGGVLMELEQTSPQPADRPGVGCPAGFTPAGAESAPPRSRTSARPAPACPGCRARRRRGRCP